MNDIDIMKNALVYKSIEQAMDKIFLFIDTDNPNDVKLVQKWLLRSVIALLQKNKDRQLDHEEADIFADDIINKVWTFHNTKVYGNKDLK